MQLDIEVSSPARDRSFLPFFIAALGGHRSSQLVPPSNNYNNRTDAIDWLLIFGLVTFGPVTDGQTDRQTESDAYKPTVHTHRWA